MKIIRWKCLEWKLKIWIILLSKDAFQNVYIHLQNWTDDSVGESDWYVQHFHLPLLTCRPHTQIPEVVMFRDNKHWLVHLFLQTLTSVPSTRPAVNKTVQTQSAASSVLATTATHSTRTADRVTWVRHFISHKETSLYTSQRNVTFTL